MATKAKQEGEKPCPNCGHCPTCGHTPAAVTPWVYPYPVYPQPWGLWQTYCGDPIGTVGVTTAATFTVNTGSQN